MDNLSPRQSLAIEPQVLHASGEPQSPSMVILSKEDLKERDRQAVAYSKALLVEGDTLVYITFPGDRKCFDSTGFEISAAPHRVHSGRLLATGSKVFEKLLGPTEQFRIMRRKKLIKNLPAGISFVLDLTPPDEGDEAVLLTTELSCTYGVRCWYTSSIRCGVAKTLVAGEDEIIAPRKTTLYSPPKGDGPDVSTSTSTEKKRNSLFVSRNSEKPTSTTDEAVSFAVKELEKIKATEKAVGQLEVPEYCAARHRAGIGRLLHVIEGKDPRLDSAPKVWTLFALAKYFDCSSAVVDWIVPWLLADPNSQFIEILPEASCKMGFGMKNYLITRAAFSILVSEEALSLAAREVGHREADRKGTNQFGRLREDIDEDLRTRIEYASKAFHDRISGTFDTLVDERMEWLELLPEFQKLKKFEAELRQGGIRSDKCEAWLEAGASLQGQLRTFIRDKILATLKQPLDLDDRSNANKHRRAEQYLADPVEQDSFTNTYNSLTEKERIFTRFQWMMIRDNDYSDNWDKPSVEESLMDCIKTKLKALDTLNFPTTILHTVWLFNSAVIEVCRQYYAYHGTMPLGAFIKNSFERDDAPQPKRSDLSGPSTGQYWTTNWNRFPATRPDVLSYGNIAPKTLAGVNDGGSSVAKEENRDIKDAAPSTKFWPSGAPEVAPPETAASPIRTRFSLQTIKQQLGFSPKNETCLDEEGQQSSLQLDPSDQTNSSACDLLFPISIGPETSSDKGKPDKNPTSLHTMQSSNSPNKSLFSSIGPSGSTAAPQPTLTFSSFTPENNPFFSFDTFCQQVKTHVRKIAIAMLSASDIVCDIAVTDTLLCLSQDEFKYLPLWAGGDDDDSGGVFNETIPIATAGPSGPGPAFHTGFSEDMAYSSGSRTGSDWDALSDSGQRSGTVGFNTSIAVEDGHSDHIDRRVVMAINDGDFSSVTISSDGGEDLYRNISRESQATKKDKGKGKAINRDDFSVTSASTLSAESEMTFSATGSNYQENDFDFNMDVDVDADVDVEVGEEEDDDNVTTVGEIDEDEPEHMNEDEDDDQWDGGEEESFEFADMNDDSDGDGSGFMVWKGDGVDVRMDNV